MKNRIVRLSSIVIAYLLTIGTTVAGVTVIGNLTREKTTTMGEMYSGEIIIQNTGDDLEEVEIYQTDYLFDCNGTSSYGEPNQIPRSNAGWIDFGPKRFVIPAGQRAQIHYTVRVPAVDTLSGSYWSILMVEAIPVSSPESVRFKGGVGINTVVRYGIQMVNHIGTNGNRQIAFLGAELQAEEGKKILQIDIENVGDWLLRPLMWVDVYGEQGQHIGMFEGDRLRTYPGTSVRHRIELGSIPPGTYKALVVADCGGDDLFGIQYTLTID